MLALWLHMLIRHQRRITIPLITVVSTGFGVLVACIVLLLSLLLLYPIDRYPSHFELVSYSFPSAALIFFLSALVQRSMSVPNNSLEVEMPALFDRLEKIPHAKQVLSLTAQDHYVEVSTDLGSELCLMRLSGTSLTGRWFCPCATGISAGIRLSRLCKHRDPGPCRAA